MVSDERAPPHKPKRSKAKYGTNWRLLLVCHQDGKNENGKGAKRGFGASNFISA